VADNWLKPYRFTAVLLPRRDLSPADVMYRSNGSFDQKVGNLSNLFSSEHPEPAATSGEPTGSIARSIEKKVEAKLGARILGALFGGGASSKLGADLEAKHATTLSITYEDVTQDSVAVLELQSWLEAARVQTSMQAMGWLNDEKLAAVTAVLRTAKLSIVAERANGVSIELKIPEIEGLVGGEVKVSSGSTSDSKITFTGEEPIAFGFQAFVMNFEGNVSFGLEEARDAGLTAEEEREAIEEVAWTADDELEQVSDGALPSD
jgi:hypothetical protein